MPDFRAFMRCAFACWLSGACAVSISTAQEPSRGPAPFHPTRLEYRVDWRLVTAGTSVLTFTRGSAQTVDVSMKLESAGLLSRLYRVLDDYKATTNDRFCLQSAHLDAQEGKKHKVTQINIDASRGHSTYAEHDLVKNVEDRAELHVPSCTYDITGAVQALRDIDAQIGKPIFLPITDGKKFARVKIVPEGKETVTANDKKYPAIRYDAFLFDNVLYKRKGSLQIWISDDADRLPVMMRFQFGFPIGTVTVELVKQTNL